MSPWLDQLAREAPRLVQQRGDDYAAAGRVSILNGNASLVEAIVRGSHRYTVVLQVSGGTLATGCTCPDFAGSTTPCKHIWATCRVAATRRLLGDLDRAGPLQIVPAASTRRIGVAGDVDDEDDLLEDELPDERDTASAMRPPHPPTRDQSRREADRQGTRIGSWRPHVQLIAGAMGKPRQGTGDGWPSRRQLIYIVERDRSREHEHLVLSIMHREPKKNGAWGKLKVFRRPNFDPADMPDAADREVLSVLRGARAFSYSYGYYASGAGIESSYGLDAAMRRTVLPLVCATGRCFLRESPQSMDLKPLAWDDGEPWRFSVHVAEAGGVIGGRLAANDSGFAPNDSGPARRDYMVTGTLSRGEVCRPLSDADLIEPGGLVFMDGAIARFEDPAAFPWISVLRGRAGLRVPPAEADEFVAAVLGMSSVPALVLPDELCYEEVAPRPRPMLRIRRHRPGERPDPPGQRMGASVTRTLHAEVSFDYEGHVVTAGQPGEGIPAPAARRWIRRDHAAEASAMTALREAGLRERRDWLNRLQLELRQTDLPFAVRTLTAAGWHVEAEGRLVRQQGAVSVGVTSGIDWFDVHLDADFGGAKASLPSLLKALERGDAMVLLDDGSFGVVPEDWLDGYLRLTRFGTREGDSLRFRRAQAGLLDLLLATQPDVSVDEMFARARGELSAFDGIQPLEAPLSFVGNLRPYQREGLGWLNFLERFGFGGCLADDMGLGKTVQVLALLDSRRPAAAGAAVQEEATPSLVVVPRSLIFNWVEEAQRFTPRLRVLNHTGVGRVRASDRFAGYDVVLTTYGTLRRDIDFLRAFEFDYLILDEAQAIRNATSESAKAARLLRGRHRLALSGTPLQNHLGDLWSLFEFLNPGFLGGFSGVGGAGAGRRGAGGGIRTPDAETIPLLAQALKPFILRRTKEQVAADLPARTEQTVYCELDPPQRKIYDELRAHYREALLARVERDGMRKAQIYVLEALLRLRQAAIHPGLIDKRRVRESSAKLDALLPQLAEVLEEGHKALVFSQFTSMLAILRDRIDAMGVTYEYLDGHTRDRGARVKRFQEDPACPLFLVSLKAGGLGLNLTAADYVFLLDPWWNPAVEAQAIDRAHRIGQTRRVFAYRLIARDTVEEKVLLLQASKRALADAIISADERGIRALTRDDLELLLS